MEAAIHFCKFGEPNFTNQNIHHIRCIVTLSGFYCIISFSWRGTPAKNGRATTLYCPCYEGIIMMAGSHLSGRIPFQAIPRCPPQICAVWSTSIVSLRPLWQHPSKNLRVVPPPGPLPISAMCHPKPTGVCPCSCFTLSTTGDVTAQTWQLIESIIGVLLDLRNILICL